MLKYQLGWSRLKVSTNRDTFNSNLQGNSARVFNQLQPKQGRLCVTSKVARGGPSNILNRNKETESQD
jgi:hypothetical protein